MSVSAAAPARKAFTPPVAKRALSGALVAASGALVPAAAVRRDDATSTAVAAASGSGAAAAPGCKYYTIMYTKFSKKKHKTYDDGVLVLNGTHAIIQNMEGA